MGLSERLEDCQRFDGLRSIGHGVELELAWPDHPEFPNYGYVVRRRDLDEMVADVAVNAGATLWTATEAVQARVEEGFVRGAVIGRKASGALGTVRARYLLAAGGANSRLGRALGAPRDRPYPLGMAGRGYFPSPYHDEPWIESHLAIRDKPGN